MSQEERDPQGPLGLAPWSQHRAKDSAQVPVIQRPSPGTSLPLKNRRRRCEVHLMVLTGVWVPRYLADTGQESCKTSSRSQEQLPQQRMLWPKMCYGESNLKNMAQHPTHHSADPLLWEGRWEARRAVGRGRNACLLESDPYLSKHTSQAWDPMQMAAPQGGASGSA